MMKRFVFALVIGIFAAASLSAQVKVEKFLGTWKLTDQKNMLKTSRTTITSTVWNVSLDGERIKVEKNLDGTDNGKPYSRTTAKSYKLNGGTTTCLLPFNESYSESYMRYISDNEIRFFYNSTTDQCGQNAFTLKTREDWSLSGDEKNLTVEVLVGGLGSRKYIYEKQ